MGRLKDAFHEMLEGDGLLGKGEPLDYLWDAESQAAAVERVKQKQEVLAPAKDGFVVKDSGERRTVSTGSRRDVRDGKGRYDLIQWRAIGLVARQLEEGAKKYGERNWELGQPLSWYLDSATRHLGKHCAGYRDERHDVAAAWNVLCFLDTVVRIEEGLLPMELDDVNHFSKEQRDAISCPLPA